MLDRINFAKTMTVLAITFGLGLGACGLTFVASRSGAGPYLMPFGLLELAVIILSAFGLVITAVLWVVASALGHVAPGKPEIQRLFEQDETKNDEGP